MRKYFKYNILGLALIVIGVVACETASQEVSPVISPDGYPVATFTSNLAGTSISEGDTIKYTITLDKMLDRALTFTAKVKGGTADETDFTAEGVVLEPYTKEAKFYIIATADNFPEASETLQLEIGVFGIGDRYLLNQSQVNPSLDITIANHNDPDVLTIAFGWPNPDDDIDIFAYYGSEDWGTAATSDNPEILTSIWPTDPNGTYYFDIDPFLVNTPTFDYTISIGHPNGNIQIITGTFDTENLDSYTVDTYDDWGDYPTYRLLEIENLDGVFTITNLNK